jgi:hypothetical protein
MRRLSPVQLIFFMILRRRMSERAFHAEYNGGAFHNAGPDPIRRRQTAFCLLHGKLYSRTLNEDIQDDET